MATDFDFLLCIFKIGPSLRHVMSESEVFFVLALPLSIGHFSIYYSASINSRDFGTASTVNLCDLQLIIPNRPEY